MTGPSYICDTWVKVHGSKRSDILEKLIEWSVTFYVEPLPDDMWLIAVKREALRKFEAAMAHADCGAITKRSPIVIDAQYESLLQFVTRWVWSKPEHTDKEIIETIRNRPDVLERKSQWGRVAEDTNDQHTLTKLAQVEAKRKQ